MTLLTDQDDDGKGGRRPYFKFYFEDFCTGCLKAGLSAEEVGMYVMSLGFIWTDGGETTADERRLSIRTGWDTRIIRRLKKQLVTKSKLTETDGVLRNARMEREIIAFVKVKKAAQDREAAKRERAKDVSASRPASALASALAGQHPEQIFPENQAKTMDLEARRDHIPEPESRKKKEKKEREEELPLQPRVETGIPGQAVQDAFEAYNALAKRIGLTIARLLTDQRRKGIRARLEEYRSDPLAWARALAAIERSSFLRGKNDRKWKADLDFMLQPSSFTKLVEGKYGNGAAHVPDPASNPAPAPNAGQGDALPGESFAQRIQRLSKERLDAMNSFDRERGMAPIERNEAEIPSDDPF